MAVFLVLISSWLRAAQAAFALAFNDSGNARNTSA
jgi:hypothetical protein